MYSCPYFEKNGLNGHQNQRNWQGELDFSVSRCQSWKIEKTPISSDFRRNSTIFKGGQKKLGWSAPNHNSWSKSIQSLRKLYISAIKHIYFLKKTKRNFDFCDFAPWFLLKSLNTVLCISLEMGIQFFSMAWQMFKALQHPWQSSSLEILIWGFQKGRIPPCTSSSIKLTRCQILK